MHFNPKISIVTPSFNSGKYIEQAIVSVLNQDYVNWEHIIIDGGSTDETLEILQKYEHLIWQSEPDNGMYDALNKGFELSSGEIMAYLNADDKYHPTAFSSIVKIFHDIPQINWLYGCPAAYDETGRCVAVKNSTPWSKYKYYLGEIHTIQQENIVWRRQLWNKAGSYINTNYKLAGDFELWMRFFRHEKLYVTDALIGGFRRLKPGLQLSSSRKSEYAEEVKKVYLNELILPFDQEKIKKIKLLKKIKYFLYKSRILSLTSLHSLLDRRINHLYSFPPRIIFNFDKQHFELTK